MAWSWTTVTAGSSKITATVVNELRTNTLTDVNYLKNNTSKCSGYACSTLGTKLPAAVSSGGKITGTWFNNMRDELQLVYSNAYYATAKNPQKSTYDGSKNNEVKSSYCTSKQMPNTTVRCSSENSSAKNSYYDARNEGN